MRLLRQALRGAASARNILVASDYDGTLAPIVRDPARAFPDPRAMAALHSLAELPDTPVAVISGRSTAVLQELTGASSAIELIGSHGAESVSGSPAVAPETRTELNEVRDRLIELALRFPGSRIEEKPVGVAYHYREVAAGRQAAADAEARSIADEHPALGLLTGKRVVEYVATEANKGGALRSLQNRHGSDVVIFVGDDVTDEDAFAVLRWRDIGIKVGLEPTRARFHVDGQGGVAGVLEALVVERRDRRRSGPR